MKKVGIIGPSNKFASGISYFTIALANAMSEKFEVNAILLRNLLPKFLFPGSKRVGKKISDYNFNKKVQVYNGIDWYWLPSIFSAINQIKQNDCIILQWWTSSVAHTYLLIKILNKIFWKKKLIIEFHEVLDPFENSLLPLRIYVKLMSKLIFKNNHAYVTHSESDKKLLISKYSLDKKRFFVVDHGSYDNFYKKLEVKKDLNKCNILFFGLIRPYKGVETLVEAFNKLDKNKFTLTIAGEVWENYKFDVPSDVRFIPRYLIDDEVVEEFNKADVLVLPYLRASQSGAAHIAISYGLPVIATPVGGLKESLSVYAGTTFVKDSLEIVKALNSLYLNRHKRFDNPHPWSKTIEQYERVLK